MAIREIRFSLSAILKLLKDIFGAASLTGSTSTTSDSRGIVQRPVNDYIILERWDQIVLQLQRFHLHLFLLTGFDGIEQNTIPNKIIVVSPPFLSIAGEADVAFRGALVTEAADDTSQNYTTLTTLTWDTDTYDTDDIHDTSTNTERLTVPSGVTFVRLSGNVRVTSNTNDNWVFIGVAKNGGATGEFSGSGGTFNEVGSSVSVTNCTTAIVPVIGGDYFELDIQAQDSSLTRDASQSWFAMEIIE